jgi:hypothetical protein
MTVQSMSVPPALPTSSATVLFMVAIHALALLVLLALYWPLLL